MGIPLYILSVVLGIQDIQYLEGPGPSPSPGHSSISGSLFQAAWPKKKDQRMPS
jgi:hypothetical protein